MSYDCYYSSKTSLAIMDSIKHAINSAQEHLKNSPKGHPLVLVTGGTGFVAAHVLQSFLSRGYHVRTTVRSEDKAEQVRNSHRRYAPFLSFAIVQDITTPGAFDEAVKGVDGVIHTASPFFLSVEDNVRDLLDPAIKGTTEILQSVAAHAPQVKRVVITSSFAAILTVTDGLRPGYTYSERDWNPVTYEVASAPDTKGGIAYPASKTFAEKAAFKFVEEKKPNFTIATICPPMIYGPLAHYADIKKLNTSSADIWRFIDGSLKDAEGPGPTPFPLFADVRDVGEAHAKAYEHHKHSNERYFITTGNFLYNDVCKILQNTLKGTEYEGNVPNPEGTARAESYKADTSKAKKELGMDFISLEKCISDTTKSLIQLKEAEKTGKQPEYVSEAYP